MLLFNIRLLLLDELLFKDFGFTVNVKWLLTEVSLILIRRHITIRIATIVEIES